MPGMLFLMFVQSLVQFEAKEGNERAIMGRKIILTCLLITFNRKSSLACLACDSLSSRETECSLSVQKHRLNKLKIGNMIKDLA